MEENNSDNLKMLTNITSKCGEVQRKHLRTQEIFSLSSSWIMWLNLTDDGSANVLSPKMNWAPSTVAVTVLFLH